MAWKRLEPYLPDGSLDAVTALWQKHPFQLKISAPRVTKLGDYRPPRAGKSHRISVNGNLNPYEFLIILLHEYAHLLVYENYGPRAAPHGSEWQNSFREVALPFLAAGYFPPAVAREFKDHLQRGQASTSRHLGLKRALAAYNKEEPEKEIKLPYLEELPEGAIFAIKKKIFRKGPLARKRYHCTELGTDAPYLVHPLAAVLRLPALEED